MKLIIDTDPGIDDTMAYYYAHASDALDLLALSTVFGNVHVHHATRNALWLVEESGAKTKVYSGAGKPLHIRQNPPPEEIHGKEGMGEVDVPEPSISAQAEQAAAFLVSAAREHKGELTLCAVGPLTNVALAVQKDPDFISNLHQLVIMGGTLYAKGNVSAHAEANFWNDPHAANIVVNAPGEGQITIVGLDVTNKISFTPQDFRDLKDASPKTGGLLKDVGDFYMAFYQQRSGDFLCSLHDPAAVIACHKPELFEMESVPLSVVTEGEEIGKMYRDVANSGRKCRVCVKADGQGVLNQYKKIVEQNP